MSENIAPPPRCTKKPLISEMCIYIKSYMCKWGLGTRGDDVLWTKNQRDVGLQHIKYIIANGKLRQSSTFWLKHEIWHNGSSWSN